MDPTEPCPPKRRCPLRHCSTETLAWEALSGLCWPPGHFAGPDSYKHVGEREPRAALGIAVASPLRVWASDPQHRNSWALVRDTEFQTSLSAYWIRCIHLSPRKIYVQIKIWEAHTLWYTLDKFIFSFNEVVLSIIMIPILHEMLSSFLPFLLSYIRLIKTALQITKINPTFRTVAVCPIIPPMTQNHPTHANAEHHSWS